MAKIPLEYPIPYLGEELSELWLTRAKLGDLRGIEDVGNIDTLLLMIPKLAAISVEEAEEIDPVDLPKLTEVIGDFLSSVTEPSAETGSA